MAWEGFTLMGMALLSSLGNLDPGSVLIRDSGNQWPCLCIRGTEFSELDRIGTAYLGRISGSETSGTV